MIRLYWRHRCRRTAQANRDYATGRHTMTRHARIRITLAALFIAALLTSGPSAIAQTTHTRDCPNPAAPGVIFGGTTIAVVSVKGPEGGIIHEVRGRTHVEIGDCPPIKGKLSYRLEIKVRRGARFRWIPTGTLAEKDVSNLPPGTKFELTSRRDCNPHGKASYRVYIHAAAGINGDGTPSPPATRYLPVPKGVQKHCR